MDRTLIYSKLVFIHTNELSGLQQIEQIVLFKDTKFNSAKTGIRTRDLFG